MQCLKPCSPEMTVQYSELTEEDRSLYNQYFEDYPVENSEMNFNAIYMWQKYWPLYLAESDDGTLFLLRRYRKRTPCFWVPLCADNDLRCAIISMMNQAESGGWPFEMRGVNEAMKQKLEALFPGRFDYVYDRNFSDYVYKGEDLRELRGKKFHAKRNHINRFVSDYPNHVFRRATAEDLPACEKIIRDSLEAVEQENRLDEELYVLRHTFELGLKGLLDFAVLEIDGKVEGYTAGEQHTKDTVLIHLEVANRDINGAYAFLNREFLREYYPHAEYVNREEDVGMEGLRKAKTSYNPDHLLNKYTVYRKGAPRAANRFTAN